MSPTAPNGHSAQDIPSTIILWCHPRSTSTMFERAFLNRPDEFNVLHEPLGDYWYFGKDRVSTRYTDAERAEKYSQHKDLTLSQSWKDVTTTKGDKRTFSKDMAQYIQSQPKSSPTAPRAQSNNPTFVPSESLLDLRIIHTFLIRTPAKAVPSYYKLCSGSNCAKTGFHFFDPSEVGLSEVKALYDYIVQHRGSEQTILIDSGDLLENPEGYMKAYCEKVGVDWQPEMLKWDSGNQKHFDKWAGWHVDAEKSTGISKPKTCTADEQQTWPEEVEKAIKDNMSTYEYLYSKRLVL